MATTIKRKIKILYWNARSFFKRKEDIQVALADIDIFICVESWLKQNANIKFPGFVSYRLDRTHSSEGGIIFLIRSYLAYRKIKNFDVPDSAFEICGISINNIEPPVSLIACYKAPDLVFSLEEWDKVFVNFKNEKNCIVFGDFNAHHIDWNCNKTETNGENLLECINRYKFFIHNNDTYTHIDSTFTSNIDLILSSKNIAENIDVQVNDETWGSDHYPIYVNYSAEKHIYLKNSHKIRSSQTNWNNVSQILKDNYDNFLTSNYENLSASHKYEYFVT